MKKIIIHKNGQKRFNQFIYDDEVDIFIERIKREKTYGEESEYRIEKIDGPPDYTERRKIAYRDNGLTFEKWTEMDIEGDDAGKADYRQRVAAIKQMYPRPQ